jgi:predicted nuclease of predicted toxin-antitoxin system
VKVVIDMNLSPEWEAVLRRHGIQAVHWSTVGKPQATDAEIMVWARATGHTVFTHDLGFGALLAAAAARGPSVIQVRTQDVTPGCLETVLVTALQAHRAALENGALVTVDEARSRVRILPLERSGRV